MLLSPVFAAHCQGQLLWLPARPRFISLTGVSPSLPKHFRIVSAMSRGRCAGPNPTSLPRRRGRFGLGWFLFVRHYFGNPCWFLFLVVLRCFNSHGSISAASAAECAGAQDSHSEISGSQVTCASPELIAACHVLRLSSSLAILLLASVHWQYSHILHDYARRSSQGAPAGASPLHPSCATFVAHCTDGPRKDMRASALVLLRR